MAEENTTNNQEQAADRKEDKDWADAIKVRGGEEVSPAAGDGGDSKILNQEEIDSLFGYTPDEEDEDYEMKTGVRAILNAKTPFFPSQEPGKRGKKGPSCVTGQKLRERSGGHENRIEEKPKNDYN